MILLYLHTKATHKVDKPNDKIIIHDVCSFPYANNKYMIGNIINLATEAYVHDCVEGLWWSYKKNG